MADKITGKLSGVLKISGNISPVAGLNGVLNTPTVVGINDYNKLINKPSIEGIELIGDMSLDALNIASKTELVDAIAALNINVSAIYIGTQESFDSQVEVISEKNAVYIYTNHSTNSQGQPVPDYKIGDGKAYLIDLPFANNLFEEHINNSAIHITNAERAFWNNKVSAYYSLTDEETLVLTTE